MDSRLTALQQTADEVTATFSNGLVAMGDVLVGADGINSATLELAWPNPRPRRWTEVTCFRGLVPRADVAALRKADGSPLDNNPADSFSMDRHKTDTSAVTTYWVRGGELLNIWIARYEPESTEFEQEEGDWFPVNQAEVVREVSEAFAASPNRDDLVALAGAVVRPTKWGLYDRDALDSWVQGRVCLLGDAAHPMLPTFGQGAAQSFEDAAALSSAFALHGREVGTALLHYERVRHYRATRFQLGSKFAFDHLRARDTAEQKALLERLDERVSPAFAHDKRGGENDDWIYAYDARDIGSELPPKKLGRGTSAKPPRPTTLRSRGRYGRRRVRPMERAMSRAKRSLSTTRMTIVGSSSQGKFTTLPSGPPIIPVAQGSPGCTPARMRLRNSVITTVPRPSRIWPISASATFGPLDLTRRNCRRRHAVSRHRRCHAGSAGRLPRNHFGVAIADAMDTPRVVRQGRVAIRTSAGRSCRGGTAPWHPPAIPRNLDRAAACRDRVCERRDGNP